MSIFQVGGARPATKVEPLKGKSKTATASDSSEDKEKQGPGILWVVLAWIVRKACAWRWQLAPVYLGLVLLFASLGQRISNGILLTVCAASIGALSTDRRPHWHARVLKQSIKRDKKSCFRGAEHLGASRPQHFFRLALIERRAAALGLLAGVAWLAITAYPMPFLLDLGLLVAMLAYPSKQWLTSPWRVKPAKPNPRTQLILDSWKNVISINGPTALVGSKIITSTVDEIPGGGLMFTARLAMGQHPADAVSEDVRKKIEALMAPKPIGMPIDSVQLSALRDADGADRIRITMSPTRHLELEAIEWPGIGFDQDGWVPMAQDVGGGIVSVPTYNESGALPFLASGTSDMGKSNDALVHVAPGVFDPVIKETLIYIDGGGGASSVAMNMMATIVANEPTEWAAALKIAMAIRTERNRRMKDMRLDTWQPGPEAFNMITVHIAEPNSVMLALPDSYNAGFGSFAQQARKAGMRWGQEPQRTTAPQILGGLAARETAVGIGSMFIHSPGGGDNSRSATDGVPIKGIENVVNALPSEGGMAVVTHRKKVSSQSCRIFWAKPRLIQILNQQIADGWKPTPLADWELEIAARYGWTPGRGFALEEETTEEGSTVVADKFVEKSEKIIGREKIMEALKDKSDGLKAGEIVEITGMSRATVDRRLQGLVNAGDLAKSGQSYLLAEFVLADSPQDHTGEGEAA
jgi:hypothetical protein